MEIVEKNEIDVEAYYARCGPMVLRRCSEHLQEKEMYYV